MLAPDVEIRGDIFILIILAMKPPDILWFDFVSCNLFLTQCDAFAQTKKLFAIHDSSRTGLVEVEGRQDLFCNLREKKISQPGQQKKNNFDSYLYR